MKTFVILGMHRSATSLVAKGLAHEINMGAQFEYAPDNPEGHWENWDIVNLNDKILKEAGGSWDNPPSREAILEAGKKYEPDIKEIVDRFNRKGEHWGFKDPRTALTVELFVPHLVEPHYIAVFRNPTEVAKSLKVRNGFDLSKGIALAKEYNQRILDFLNKVW
jgi:hypothetical protein